MPDPTFTTPPDAPSRAVPSTFSSLTDAFLAWMVVFKGELTTAVSWFSSTASTVSTDAGTATTQAGIATTQAGNAATSAGEASASAGAAAQSVIDAANAGAAAAGASVWISAASYTLYDAVISPVDDLTYRAITTHTGVTTDPSADATNWLLLNADILNFATLAGTETLTNKTLNLTSNTLSGTLAQFNAALSDGSFAQTASPALTGTPTAPTATSGTNTTQIATTAFVLANSGGLTTATTTGAAQTVDFANSYQIVEADSAVTTLTFSSTNAVQDVTLIVNAALVEPAISTATYTGDFKNTFAEGPGLRGCAFSPDGTKMFTIDAGADAMFEYFLPVPFDLSTAVYTGESDSVTTSTTVPESLAFNDDGTVVYVTGSGAVYSFAMTRPYDLSTVASGSLSKDFGSNPSGVYDMVFKSDGTKMYVLSTDEIIYEWDLSTAYDPSTATYSSVSVSLASDMQNTFGFDFNETGTKLYVVGQDGATAADSIYQFNLSTAWDLSTLSYSGSALDIEGLSTTALGIRFVNEFKDLVIASSSPSEELYKYSLNNFASIVLPSSVNAPTLSPSPGYNGYKFATTDSGTSYHLVSKAEGLGR